MPVFISEGLKEFLRERLSTLEQIEIVLLLRSDPSRSWTAPDVSATLGTPPESAAMRLFLLASSGLLAFEPAGVPRYRYTPTDSATEALVQELADLYGTNRPEVSALVGGPPPDPLRSFADAFKLKK